VVSTVAALRRYVTRQKRAKRTIGLVPTMGALHDGHLSLIRRSVAENDRTIVSIFVNPTQFGPTEDLSTYPRPLRRDIEACRREKAALVFVPAAGRVYPEDFCTSVEVERLTAGLCGARRPGHFRGVTTVCAKLFNMAEPDRVYFGEKDWQQLVVIRRMVADLNMNVKVSACPTVREPDGLAMSSRNVRLTGDRRRQALVLHRSLLEAKRLVEREGVRAVTRVTRAMRRLIKTARSAKIDYVSVVHPRTLRPLDKVRDEAVVALAVFIDGTRLIDNVKVRAKGGK
jgi:pantoate--beta-alanine ligase